jgi:O-succinylbenzoate synthase
MSNQDIYKIWVAFKEEQCKSSPEYIRYHRDADRIIEKDEQIQQDKLNAVKNEWEEAFGKGTFQ